MVQEGFLCPANYQTCSHVFLRNDAVHAPLQPNFTGPHLVIDRDQKVFNIVFNGKPKRVSIDGLKPDFRTSNCANRTSNCADESSDLIQCPVNGQTTALDNVPSERVLQQPGLKPTPVSTRSERCVKIPDKLADFQCWPFLEGEYVAVSVAGFGC